MASSETNPQLGPGYTELSKLASDALREFGDFAPGSTNGDVGHMLLAFANQVIDEVRAHPYWSGAEIDYYVHPTDKRAVPDTIIKAGIKFFYADQQGSGRAQSLGQNFIRILNRELWHLLNGNTVIRMRPVDAPASNETNGLPEDE